MRWLDGITNSVDVVKDREAWSAAVWGEGEGHKELNTKLATEQQQSVVKNQGFHCRGTVHPWLGN